MPEEPAASRLTVGEFATNCWIVPLETGAGGKAAPCLLIDPGGDAAAILRRLSALALEPRTIVLTHAHFDHLAALPDIAAAYPGAGIAVHRAEAAKLGPASREAHLRDFNEIIAGGYVDRAWRALPEASILLDEGDSLAGFTVLHLPGHSPGSIGLLRDAGKLLFSGDTLFRAGLGRTDLPGGDRDALETSLGRLLGLPGDTRVYPGHGDTTTIARERPLYS